MTNIKNLNIKIFSPIRTLVKLYRGLQTPDYVQMCQCLIFLDQPLAVADVLGMMR
jgi:hypothetical protein